MSNDRLKYSASIQASGLTIYDTIDSASSPYWIPTPILEGILDESLAGYSLSGLALRTRSKRLKQLICIALGYPIPATFRKTRPRFPGQNFDTYGMKANNLQVFNEDLSPDRRYALVRIDNDDTIKRVRVFSGDRLQILDTTGTITLKHQARFVRPAISLSLLSAEEELHIQALYGQELSDPSSYQISGALLPIKEVLDRLSALIGYTFDDVGADQERNRGAILHRLACRALGYSVDRDRGRIPDITQQLLEVKLQTSLTIDLGLVAPDSTDPLPVCFPPLYGVRFCDLRYAIFGATKSANRVKIISISLAKGSDFYHHFRGFGGLRVNQKLQIRLPKNFL